MSFDRAKHPHEASLLLELDGLSFVQAIVHEKKSNKIQYSHHLLELLKAIMVGLWCLSFQVKVKHYLVEVGLCHELQELIWDMTC